MEESPKINQKVKVVAAEGHILPPLFDRLPLPLRGAVVLRAVPMEMGEASEGGGLWVVKLPDHGEVQLHAAQLQPEDEPAETRRDTPLSGDRRVLVLAFDPKDPKFPERAASAIINDAATADIIVTTNGMTLKDRYLDAEEVLAQATGTAVAEIGGREVARRLAVYLAIVYGGRWGAKRAVRKHDGPDWAVALAARLSMIVGARAGIEAAQLDPKGAKEVGQYLAKKIIASKLGSSMIERSAVRAAEKAKKASS